MWAQNLLPSLFQTFLCPKFACDHAPLIRFVIRPAGHGAITPAQQCHFIRRYMVIKFFIFFKMQYSRVHEYSKQNMPMFCFIPSPTLYCNFFSVLHCNSSAPEGWKSTKLCTAWFSSSVLHAVFYMKTISKSLSNYPVFNANFTVYSVPYIFRLRCHSARSCGEASETENVLEYSSTRVLDYYYIQL